MICVTYSGQAKIKQYKTLERNIQGISFANVFKSRIAICALNFAIMRNHAFLG